MNLYDIPEEAQIMALEPPVFHALCVRCGLLRQLLPWQLSTGEDSWGPVCPYCAKPLLTKLLESRLPSLFSEAQFEQVLVSIAVCEREAGFLFADFQREGTITRASSNGFGFCWSHMLVQCRDEMFSTETRADVEEYCILLDRYVLVLDGVCFYRQRSAKCRLCILDLDTIAVKLIWLLADFIEDSEEGRRHSTHG